MMKTLFLYIIFLLTVNVPQLVYGRGGDIVGNGGVIWACRSYDHHTFYSGVLTDLFEAKEQYGWTLIKEADNNTTTIYEQRKMWLQRELPELYNSLKPRFEYVEQHQTFVNAELLSTNDFNNAIKPTASTCPFGEWQPLNIANFRENDQQVLISAELWNSPSLANLDKAALLFHEAIYYWMRSQYGSTNSDKARKITGILFSTLPTGDIKTLIHKIIGDFPEFPDGKFICIMKNSKRNQLYIAYDNDLNDASIKVQMICQNDSDGNWCNRSSVECEEFISETNFRCIAENSMTNKIYLGNGRNLLEAQSKAHISCYIDSQNQSSAPQGCPDFPFMNCN